MCLNHKSQNFRNFCFTSCYTTNLLTVIDDRIARVLKTSGEEQRLFKVWHTGLLYKLKLNVVMERCFTEAATRDVL